MAGTRTAPTWIVPLDAAREWGRPPWEIVGGSPLLWYLRYKVRREVEGEAAEKKRALAEQQAWLNGLT